MFTILLLSRLRFYNEFCYLQSFTDTVNRFTIYGLSKTTVFFEIFLSKFKVYKNIHVFIVLKTYKLRNLNKRIIHHQFLVPFRFRHFNTSYHSNITIMKLGNALFWISIKTISVLGRWRWGRQIPYFYTVI